MAEDNKSSYEFSSYKPSYMTADDDSKDTYEFSSYTPSYMTSTYSAPSHQIDFLSPQLSSTVDTSDSTTTSTTPSDPKDNVPEGRSTTDSVVKSSQTPLASTAVEKNTEKENVESKIKITTGNTIAELKNTRIYPEAPTTASDKTNPAADPNEEVIPENRLRNKGLLNVLSNMIAEMTGWDVKKIKMGLTITLILTMVGQLLVRSK